MSDPTKPSRSTLSGILKGWDGAGESIFDLPSELEAFRAAEARVKAKRRRLTPKSQRPRCGAKCRSRGGAACQAAPVWDHEQDRARNGRCKNHGGGSTGPKTPAGKAKVAQNLPRYTRQCTRDQTP